MNHEYIARQVDGLTLDAPVVRRYDAPYSAEFANPWGLKACPYRPFLYGEEMTTWYHLPELEGYGDAESEHETFLPYDEFEVYAMAQGWE